MDIMKIGTGSAVFKVTQIRHLLMKQTARLNGYLITSYDQHISEYVASQDRRLEFITGFTGSVGKAIITETEACLWVDGRYYIQAAKEIQSPFRLMKSGAAGVPAEWEWLIDHFQRGGTVGACGKYVPSSVWTFLSEKLRAFSIELIDVRDDLTDLIWKQKTLRPCSKIVPHPKQFTGRTAGEKVEQMRSSMKKNKADVLIITELDDIAWLFNLRGSDIPHNPVVFSFAIITMKHIDLFVDCIDECVMHQLFVENIILCDHEYDAFYDELEEVAGSEEFAKIWISNKSNQRVHHCIPKMKLFVSPSPVSAAKCIKNNVEASGMIEAHVYDGHALCKFFCWIEKEIKRKHPPSEMTAAEKLEEIKRQNRDFVGPSFYTISASGPHSAVVHYVSKPETDRILSISEMYLCDSGSQYQCGTTDVTRTYHFGEPTDFQKEAYTRVFKGQVSLSTAVFPDGTRGSALDALARRHLWSAGLDYNHGTGHGVGAFLNVHEGPVGISRDRTDDLGLQANMFVSNEPGYYQEDSFGIRLENVEHVVKAFISPNEEISNYLTFETITLCPYQTSLMIPAMLSQNEVKYLNTYHDRIRSVLCPVFKSENNAEVYDWVMNMTKPLDVNTSAEGIQ